MKRDYPAELAFQCKAVNLPEPVLELRFHPVRRWRFDLAWPDEKLAVEIQGGIWLQGHHSRGKGITDDCEKSAHALILGWRVLPLVPSQVQSGEALQWLEQILRTTSCDTSQG